MGAGGCIAKKSTAGRSGSGSSGRSGSSGKITYSSEGSDGINQLVSAYKNAGAKNSSPFAVISAAVNNVSSAAKKKKKNIADAVRQAAQATKKTSEKAISQGKGTKSTRTFSGRSQYQEGQYGQLLKREGTFRSQRQLLTRIGTRLLNCARTRKRSLMQERQKT